MITPSEFKYATYFDEGGDAERRIDKAIRACTKLPVKIATSLLGNDYEHLLHSYRLLGWQVQTIYDSRDGDYVEMTLP